MILAVASGKGGTGKTTIAVNLARVAGVGVRLLDCDVEEPNAHLFLRGTAVGQDTVTLPIPEVDESRCNGCGECGRFCQYHAIVSLKTTPLVFPDLCHGCGGCMRVCPQQAIREKPRRIGVIETRQADHITLIQGRLDVGVAMAPPLIRAVKARLADDRGGADGAHGGKGADGSLAILDAPPGTSCPVIATLRGADVVLLVTEPTPFGLHDLELAAAMVRQLGIPCGVAVNRVGIGDDRVHRYCAREGIPLLAEIPDDRRIAEAYSRGELVVDALPEYRGLVTGLLASVATLRSTATRAPSPTQSVRERM